MTNFEGLPTLLTGLEPKLTSGPADDVPLAVVKYRITVLPSACDVCSGSIAMDRDVGIANGTASVSILILSSVTAKCGTATRSAYAVCGLCVRHPTPLRVLVRAPFESTVLVVESSRLTLERL